MLILKSLNLSSNTLFAYRNGSYNNIEEAIEAGGHYAIKSELNSGNEGSNIEKAIDSAEKTCNALALEGSLSYFYCSGNHGIKTDTSSDMPITYPSNIEGRNLYILPVAAQENVIDMTLDIYRLEWVRYSEMFTGKPSEIKAKISNGEYGKALDHETGVSLDSATRKKHIEYLNLHGNEDSFFCEEFPFELEPNKLTLKHLTNELNSFIYFNDLKNEPLENLLEAENLTEAQLIFLNNHKNRLDILTSL